MRWVKALPGKRRTAIAILKPLEPLGKKLDEVNIALKLGYLSVEQVLAGLDEKPETSHVILTGRGAPKELIERADLVTEMTLVKHPFKAQGVKALAGLEF